MGLKLKKPNNLNKLLPLPSGKKLMLSRERK
jgi:hypothetical protein